MNRHSMPFVLLAAIGVSCLAWFGVRLSAAERRAEVARACAAGRTLSGCVRLVGPPRSEYVSKAGGAKVSLWPSGSNEIEPSATTAILSREGIIVAVLNLDLEDDMKIFGRYPQDAP